MSEPHYEPTPAEIRRMCAVIRSEWTPEVEQSRRAGGFQRQEWSVPGADRNAEIVDAETLTGFAGPN